MSHSIVKACDQVIGVSVKNRVGEHLGKIKELMLGKVSGQVAYVVLDSGSFLGIGGKYFALPWSSFHYDKDEECFLIDIDKERLESAPGFDKDHWPDMADKNFSQSIHDFYGTKFPRS